jgi:alpha-tubulin suppressor-like RCC1 family protein
MGRDHACALRDSGHIYCWGSGAQGRLGNGGTSDQFTPAQVEVTGVGGEVWTTVSAGGRRHSCGLRDDGTAWCWGWNTTGQLGSGVTSTEELTPVPVTAASVSGSSWTTVAAGHRHSCGVRDDGTGWCWGWNEYGQIGNGDNLDQHAPAALSTVGVSGSSWIQLSPAGVNDDDTASRHTCGLRDDGTAWCWGDGTDGRLGTGTSDIVNTPTKLDDGAGSGSSWIAIQASYRNGCGLRADRTLWCWGSGASAIGTGEASSGTNSTPLRVDESLLPPGTAWGY